MCNEMYDSIVAGTLWHTPALKKSVIGRWASIKTLRAWAYVSRVMNGAAIPIQPVQAAHRPMIAPATRATSVCIFSRAMVPASFSAAIECAMQ